MCYFGILFLSFSDGTLTDSVLSWKYFIVRSQRGTSCQSPARVNPNSYGPFLLVLDMYNRDKKKLGHTMKVIELIRCLVKTF